MSETTKINELKDGFEHLAKELDEIDVIVDECLAFIDKLDRLCDSCLTELDYLRICIKELYDRKEEKEHE